MAKKKIKWGNILKLGIGGVFLIALIVLIVFVLNFVVMYALAAALLYALEQLHLYSGNIWVDSIWVGVILVVLSIVFGTFVSKKN